jgi:predicted MFS family arabinose efflux permease
MNSVIARFPASSHSGDAVGRWRALAVLSGAMVLAMSAWFSTVVVVSQLRVELGMSGGAATGSAVAVQLGFVVGALLSAALALPDRIPPRRLAVRGAMLTAAVNLVPALWAHTAVLTVSRALVGASLALVCPPLLATVSTWFRRQRGVALGVMVGGLTVGSAVPHLVNGLGGPPWRMVLLVTSVGALAAGALARWGTTDGPHRVAPTDFDARRIGGLVRNRGVRLAAAGYLGHMWELYAAWTWIGLFMRGVLGGDERTASLVTFAVIGVGAVGAVVGGLLGDAWGKARTAQAALVVSGGCASVIGFTGTWPSAVVVVLALVWGFWVIADSAQFTALVIEHARPDQVGTAVTVQLAAGFALTAATMWIVPVVEGALGWGPALAVLAPGPFLGALAMHRLRRLPAFTVAASPAPRPASSPPQPRLLAS